MMASSLKTSLLSLGCPLVRPEEDEDDLEAALTTSRASHHRMEILGWLADRAESVMGMDEGDTQRPSSRLAGSTTGDEEGRARRAMAFRMASLGMPGPEEFVAASEADGGRGQRRKWRLLLRMASQSQSQEGEEGAELDLREATSSSSESRESFARSAARGQLRLVPRDLEKEIWQKAGNKVAAPSEQKLKEILHMYREEIRKTNEKQVRCCVPPVVTSTPFT